MQNGDVEPYGRPRSEQVQKNSRPKANSPESDKDKADGSNSSLQEESGEPRGRETALANSSSATLRADRADSFCLLCRGGSISSFSSVGSGGGNRASGLSLEALQASCKLSWLQVGFNWPICNLDLYLKLTTKIHSDQA